jgi:hypothetical protein
VSLIRKLIVDGRLHKRTVVHRDASNRPDVVSEYAREVNQFLQEGQVDVELFLKELARLNTGVAQRVSFRKATLGTGRSSKTA